MYHNSDHETKVITMQYLHYQMCHEVTQITGYVLAFIAFIARELTIPGSKLQLQLQYQMQHSSQHKIKLLIVFYE